MLLDSVCVLLCSEIVLQVYGAVWCEFRSGRVIECKIPKGWQRAVRLTRRPRFNHGSKGEGRWSNEARGKGAWVHGKTMHLHVQDYGGLI